MASTKAEYIIALLQEVERIQPPKEWCETHPHHGVTWEHNDSGDILILLVCVGDALWKYKINPDDLSDDPAETAARLVAQFKSRMVDDGDPAHYM
jgi:hypothetical protein